MSELAGDLRRNYGPYEIESVLGRGAMGMVYLAKDKRIGRKVALKTVHVDERFEDDSEANEFYKRLQREAELCGALQHPNIVTLYEPGYDNETIAWLATEYIDGESLRERMKKRKPLPLVEALRITQGILRGLAFAHSKGIIHRDIKPANILLTSAGEAKIADFGIARPVDSNLTAAGEMLGTPSYMSPEQVKCTAVTAKSDLFSVGAVLYEMVTGVKAFAASDVSGILRNVCELEPRPAHEAHAQVPESVSALLKRLLAKHPEARYPSAAAALQHLTAILGEIAPEAAEDAGAADAASTMSAARRAKGGPATQPSITAVSRGDATAAIGSRGTTSRMFDRPLPPALFIGVVAVALLLFAGAAIAIRMQTDETPTITFSPEELRYFDEKRQQLAAARKLYSAGRLQEALTAYDAYLVRHPTSLVAREERGETLLALEAQAKSATELTVSSKAPTKRRSPTKKASEQPQKKGWWSRVFGKD